MARCDTVEAMRWEPLHELVVWQRAPRFRMAESSGWAPPADLYETTEAFIITIELAGFRAGDFDVQATDDSVTISGQRTARPGDGQFLHIERGQGVFARRFTFPHRVDVGDIAAAFDNGLLTIKIPKITPRGPQQVPVAG
jgi:HSP20 family protein